MDTLAALFGMSQSELVFWTGALTAILGLVVVVRGDISPGFAGVACGCLVLLGHSLWQQQELGSSSLASDELTAQIYIIVSVIMMFATIAAGGAAILFHLMDE
jgi:hypothetical protein